MSEPIIKEWESNSEDDEIMVKPKEVTITIKPNFEKIESVNAKNETVRQAENSRKNNKGPRVVLRIGKLQRIGEFSGVRFTSTQQMFTMSYNKELAILEQMATGKEISNPLMANSLPKTIWLSIHHVLLQRIGYSRANGNQIQRLSTTAERFFEDASKQGRIHYAYATVTEEEKVDDDKETAQEFPTQTQVVDEAAFISVDVDARGAATTDNSLEAGQGSAAASGNLFMIELFNLTHKLNSWVYDTGCGIHICNTLQGFRVKRKLSYGEQYLHVGNGAQAAVEVIGVFNLVLPSGLVLSLNNFHYAPFIVRGVVSFSCLLDLGFVHTVTSNGT
ncbi:hypothetical protein Tco_1302342 [Tanacetum coccineum]